MTVLVVAFLWQSPSAFAQDALEDGRRLIRDGQFDAALNVLLPAYAAAPTGQLAFAIGRAYDASNEVKDALRFYSAALSIKVRRERLTSTDKRMIRKRMRSLKKANRSTLSMATLNVQSNAPRAHVFLDRKPVGLTPLTGLLISAGSHTIRVQREGYGDWTAQFNVGPSQTINLKADMPSISAGVFVQTTPPGATATVPNGPSCVTPCLLSLGPGNYQLTFKKTGYARVVQTLRRLSGAYQAWPMVMLARLGGDAQVSLRCSVEGAIVMLDGRIVGQIPLSTPIPVTLGSHEISVQKQGFMPWQTTVQATQGEQLTLQVNLQSNDGDDTSWVEDDLDDMEESGSSSELRMWSWISMGVGGALVLGGGGLMGHALYNKHQLTSAARMRISDPVNYPGNDLYVLGMTQNDAVGLENMSNIEWITGWVAVGVGLAGVVTGLVLYFLDDEMVDDATVSVGPTLWGTGSGAVTTVRF